MSYNQTPYDIKQTLKRGLIYLLIAFPFILVVATLLTIAKAPLWVIMLCNIVVGGSVVFVAMVINNKLKERKQNKEEANLGKKFDPFKD